VNGSALMVLDDVADWQLADMSTRSGEVRF
jgi:hypothetical protein